MRVVCFALAACVGCGAKQPPPPMIETQETQVGGSDGEDGAERAQVAPGPAAGIPSGPSEPPRPLEVGPAPGAGAEPKLTLDAPGEEPRKVYSHKYKAGAKYSYFMASTAKVSGIALPIPAIRVDAPIEIRIVSVKDGHAKFSYRAGPFKTGQSSGGALGGVLGALGGGSMPERIVATGVASPQGFVRDFVVEEGGEGDGAPMEVGDALPEQAIGKGARWTTEVVLDDKDGPVQQTGRYELLSAQGNTLEVKVQREHRPLSGGSDAPGSGTTSGALTLRLGEFYATGKMTMSKAFSISVPGVDSSAMRMQSDVVIKKR
ncbi:MAG: hypothetical protein KF718_28170 [Polyangiaceae bacterium]|nr:hypothetical protein [Polyangiaceae bacterium]